MGWGGGGGNGTCHGDSLQKEKKKCSVWNRESMLINICVQRECGENETFFRVCVCVCVSRVYEENSANKEEAPCDLNIYSQSVDRKQGEQEY